MARSRRYRVCVKATREKQVTRDSVIYVDQNYVLKSQERADTSCACEKKKWARSTSRSNRDQMCFDSKLDGVRINGKWKKLSRNIIYRWKEKDGRTMINSRIHRLNIEQKNKRVSILASACNLRNLHIYRMSLFDNKSVDTTDSCLFANYNSPWLILTN